MCCQYKTLNHRFQHHFQSFECVCACAHQHFSLSLITNGMLGLFKQNPISFMPLTVRLICMREHDLSHCSVISTSHPKPGLYHRGRHCQTELESEEGSCFRLGGITALPEGERKERLSHCWLPVSASLLLQCSHLPHAEGPALYIRASCQQDPVWKRQSNR